MVYFTDIIRDEATLSELRGIIDQAEKNGQLKTGESMMLKECMNAAHPYPTFLLKKIRQNSAIFEEQWNAYEQQIVKKVLTRNTSSLDIILYRAVDEKKLKKSEAMVCHDCIEADEFYPEFLLSKLSPDDRGFLTSEHNSFIKVKEAILRAVSATSAAAGEGSISTDEFEAVMVNLAGSLPIDTPSDLSKDANDLIYLAADSLRAYKQLQYTASTSVEKISEEDHAIKQICQFLQGLQTDRQISEALKQNIIDLIAEGEEIPEYCLKNLPKESRDALKDMYAQVLCSRVLTPGIPAAEATFDDASRSVTGSIIEETVYRAKRDLLQVNSNAFKKNASCLQLLPYDTLFIFHDGENCYLPKKTIKRDANGNRVMTGNMVEFLEQHPQGLGGISFSSVYDQVVKTALRCALLGNNIGDEKSVDAAVNELDVNCDLPNVTYHFLFNNAPTNPFYPGAEVVREMDTKGVHFYLPDSKKGSVDKKIKQLMKDTVAMCKMMNEDEVRKVLFVLISGDRDFAGDVQDARKNKIDVVVISSKDSPINRGFVSILKSPVWSSDNWLSIVYKSQLLKEKKDAIEIPQNSPNRKKKEIVGSKVQEEKDAIIEIPQNSPDRRNKEIVGSKVRIDITYPKYWFVKEHCMGKLKAMLQAKHPSLLISVETRKDVGPDSTRKGGYFVCITWAAEDGDLPLDAEEVMKKAEEDTKTFLLTVWSDREIYLPGVSSQELKESKEFRDVQRSLGVSVFLPSSSEATALQQGQNLEKNELIVEHPQGWTYQTLWKYCKEKVGIDVYMKYQPDRNDTIQNGVREGYQRSRIKLYLQDWSELDDMKKACFSFQAEDNQVFFPIITNKTTSGRIRHDPSNTDKSAYIPNAEGWKVGPLGNVGTRAVLTYLKGEGKEKDQMTQYLSMMVRVEASWELEGYAKIRLCRRRYPFLRSILEASTLTVDVQWPTMPNLRAKIEKSADVPADPVLRISVRGRSDQVQEAITRWNEMMRRVEVESIPIPSKSAARFGLTNELVQHIKKMLLSLRRQVNSPNRCSNKSNDQQEVSAGDEENYDEDDDDGATTSTASVCTADEEPSFAIALYREFIYKEDKLLPPRLCVDVAYALPEDTEERVFELSRVNNVIGSLKACINAYKEKKCSYASFREGLNPQTQKKKIIPELRKLGLFISIYFDDIKKEALLSGKDCAVEDGYKWLTEIPEEEKVGNQIARAPSSLICRLLNRSPNNNLLKEIVRKYNGKSNERVRISPIEEDSSNNGDDALLVVTAPKGSLAGITQCVEDEIKNWAASQLMEESLLSQPNASQIHYLTKTKEGLSLLRRIAIQQGVEVLQSTESLAFPSPTEIVVQERCLIGGVLELTVAKGDICQAQCVALVNPANGALNHAGGLARIIANSAGPELNLQGGQIRSGFPQSVIPIGQSVTTGAFKLNNEKNKVVQHVIHAVGPKYVSGSSQEREDYVRTIWSALDEAHRLNADSIAIPLMGSGIYRWPIPSAAKLLVDTVVAWAGKYGSNTMCKHVMLVDYSAECTSAVKQELLNWIQLGEINPAALYDRLLPSTNSVVSASSSAKQQIRPQRMWFWEHAECNRWVPYDYDQVLQIERALLKEGLENIELRGDVAGNLSDSKFVPPGERSAVYCVSKGTFWSRLSNTVCEFFQRNTVSNFQRAVRWEVFDPKKHKMYGFEEEEEVNHQQEEIHAPSPKPSTSCVSTVTVQQLDNKPVAHATDYLSQEDIRALGLPDSLKRAREKLANALQKAAWQSTDMNWQETAPLSWVEITARLEKELKMAELEVNVLIDHAGDRTVQLQGLGQLCMSKAMQVAMELRNQVIIEKMKKEAELPWPDEWTKGVAYDASQPGYTLEDVTTDSDEWKWVEEEWRGSPSINGQPKVPAARLFANNLVRIQRVQNPSAWAAYYSKLKLLAGKLSYSRSDLNNESIFARANEHWMKHGTRNTAPAIIAAGEYGLDFRYCEAGYYGKAAYTAEDASYSHSYRYNLPGSKQAQMFLVRVAAGNVYEVSKRTEEHRQLKHPPTGFHSVRGPVNENGQKAIMVYLAEQAYPAYLLTYDV